MILRLIGVVGSSLSGGASVLWWTGSSWAALGAAGSVTALWVGLDSWRAGRAMVWLQTARSAASPDLGGLWGEAVQRARKALKAQERRSRRAEARLESFMGAFQASPNGIVVLNRADAIEWCNGTASEHLGIQAERDIAQHVRNLVREPAFQTYLKVGDYSRSVEIFGRPTPGGAPCRISVQLHPYGKGRKLMLSRDVTAIELADTMRRDFVANVSHEIRTPLTVLSGFVETLLSLDLSQDERQRYLQLMQQQAERMQTLVRDLLTLSRLEGSPVPASSEWVDARDLLQQVLEEGQALSDLVAEGGHDLQAQPMPEPFEVAGSPSELTSAMSNLLSNAVRYTPAGGRIEAGWRLLADGGAEFSVSDTGPGIAAEHLPRLTERFYRVDRSRSRETGGTGLGLAIVKHIVQRHGGHIRIESELGQGSTFAISLPAARVRRQTSFSDGARTP
jgi:two-component system, OmpR family, phosphate regulon sensor histidine kinase PhoR